MQTSTWSQFALPLQSPLLLQACHVGQHPAEPNTQGTYTAMNGLGGGHGTYMGVMKVIICINRPGRIPKPRRGMSEP